MLNPVSFSLDFEDGGNGQVKLNPVVSNAAPTFTRATTAYTRLRDGLWAQVASGVARSYYDANRLYLGYLAEGARTNLCLRSNDFTNAAWTLSNTTAAKTATGPDGVANSASTLTATAANATALQAITSGSASRIASMFVKRRTGSGVINITQDNGSTWTAVTVTSDWTQVSSTNQTIANPTVGVRIVTSGDEVDVWCFMNEAGAFASTPIPTEGSAVARNADELTYTTQWVNAAEGTFLVHATTPASSATQQALLNVGDGTLNNRFTLQRITSGSTANYLVRAASSTVASINVATWDNSTQGRFAAAYAANSMNAAFNGTIGTEDTSNVVPAVTTAEIGTVAGSGIEFYGTILRVDYYPVRLPNDFLVTLSAGGDPFTKPGVSRRLRKYKKDERLEKVFPKLRDEEVEVKPEPKKAKPPVERSVTEPVQFAPDGAPIPSPTLEPVDFALNKVEAPDDDAVSMAVTGKPASKLSFEGIQIPQSVGEIPFAPIDQRVLEALFRINEFMPQQVIRPPSKAELFAMGIDEVLNHPDVLEIEKAVWMKN